MKIDIFTAFLWKFPDNTKMIKISKLTNTEAIDLCKTWVDLENDNDYIIMVEDAEPKVDDLKIVAKTKDWFWKMIKDKRKSGIK